MPPRVYSRYAFTTAQKDSNGILFLSERVPYRFAEFPDNRTHEVREGDTLFTLAAKYFPSFDRPAGLWWIIADFQPTPVFDPTTALTVGDHLIIPSERTVLERIFAEERRYEEPD